LSVPKNRSAEFNQFLEKSGDKTADKEKQFDSVEKFGREPKRDG